jgi:hypothetical protein
MRRRACAAALRRQDRRPFAPLTAAVRPLLHEADTAVATAAAAAIAADLVKAERGLRVSEL